MRVAIDSPSIIHETIDKEVVVVNFKNGLYYSLEKVAAEVWEAIACGLPVPTIIEDVAARFEGSRAEIERGVNDFVAALLQEGLVIPANGEPEKPIPRPSTNGAAGGSRLPFQPLAFVRYDDMNGLFMVDPVHGVLLAKGP